MNPVSYTVAEVTLFRRHHMFSKTKLKEKAVFFFFLITFIFLVIFFTKIHPLIIYDADDWTYIGHLRKPIPSPNEYNPGKVFPEVIQPIMARIATHFVYPATKDFIYSISIVYGVVLSIFVLLYFYEFYKLIKYLFPNITFAALFLLTSLFIIFHFSIFKVENTNNRFMFYEIDPNCVYNYTVPNILNCILIMYLIRHNFKIKSSKVEFCLLMVLGYFSIFSNSIICLATIIEHYSKSVYILLLFCIGLISFTYSKEKVFKESIMYNLNPSIAKQVDNDIMNQIISTIQDGSDEMTLIVTQSEKSDNWPHSNYVGEKICNSLQELGFIDHTIPITIRPDKEMNKKYNVIYN